MLADWVLPLLYLYGASLIARVLWPFLLRRSYACGASLAHDVCNGIGIVIVGVAMYLYDTRERGFVDHHAVVQWCFVGYAIFIAAVVATCLLRGISMVSKSMCLVWLAIQATATVALVTVYWFDTSHPVVRDRGRSPRQARKSVMRTPTVLTSSPCVKSVSTLKTSEL